MFRSKPNRLRQFLQIASLLLLGFTYQNCSNQAVSTSAASNSSTSTQQVQCTSASTPGGLSGSVVDATNKNPLTQVAVVLMNAAGSTVSTTTTNGSGLYNFANLSPGTYRMSFSKSGYITYTSAAGNAVACGETLAVNESLSPVLASGQVRIVLTWAAAPANWAAMENSYTQTVMDLDSYLTVPGAQTPVYYGNCDHGPADGGQVGCNVSGAYLDVDQIDWSGPETVTITQQVAGTYTYYIANYSDPCNNLALSNSKAQVTVYSGSQILQQFNITPSTPPSEETGLVYEVFTMTNGQITPNLRYNDALPTLLVGNSGSCDQFTNH